MTDNSFDWLQGMLVPTTPQPQQAIDTVLSIPSSQQPITSMLQQSTNVGLPVLAPLTPVMGTVEDIANGIRRMSLDTRVPRDTRAATYFGPTTEGADENLSSRTAPVNTKVAQSLLQMPAGVTALA